MIGKLDPEENVMEDISKLFKQTCNKPYDRHSYKLVGINGNELVFDSWEEAQLYWFQAPSRFLSHIEVLDKKKKTTKGFK